VQKEKDPKVNYTFFLIYLNIKEVHRQTQHFIATQQCAAFFGASEPTSGVFFIEV